MGESLSALLSSRSELGLPGGEVPWLSDIRQQGAEAFLSLGLPSVRHEDWKYTNIKPIVKRTFSIPEKGGSSLSDEQLDGLSILGLIAHRIVFIDGYFSESDSNLADIPDGVTVCELSKAIEEKPELVKPFLGHLTSNPEHGFRALNNAFIQEGLFIRLQKDIRLDQPIECLFISSTAEEGYVSQPRNLIIAEENSELSIIERYASIGDKHSLSNSITEVFALENSRIEHYKIQQESSRSYHVGSWLIEQAEKSQVQTHNVALGGAIARTDIRVRLQGEESQCGLNGVYVLNEKQHIDNHTQVDHCIADTKSNEFYKGVLADRARAVFHGRIIVHQDAQRTDAQQQNKNLLLSGDAEIDTKPQLEIYADDVSCSHGATVGQLDENALFYLQSRGIDTNTARGLLTYAFANDVINEFSLPALRSYVEHQLSNKLFGIERIEELV